jgi:diguanylate cyclase (GGDEF)-like protein
MTGEGESARPLRTRAADFAWAVFLAGTTLAVFWQTRYPVLFLLFPPLVAVLFRFRLAGAVYGTSVVVAIAAAFTAEAHGPFALFPGTTPTERVALFQIFGLLMFASCIPLGFSIEERNRLDAQLKQAIANLADLAFLDSLTGVRNRRGLDAAMESEWLIACATGSELSLLYLDIDFFKRFNDTYGHQRGDDCLRSVARILLAGVRESGDCVARYGGEEFVILLPATSAAAARTTAERIFAAMRALQVPHKGSPLGIVTASFGIATIRPSAGGNPYGLIGLADDALYAAKRGGRDRIVAKYGTDPGVTTVAPAPAAIAEAATPFGLW